MSTLSFQPEAERFYAEGYWRSGDLWADFAARAEAQPGKVALILDDRRRHLRRAAARGASRCPHASPPRSWQPGDVVILLGRHSIEAAVALLGVPAPRRRARAAAADVQRHAAVGAQQPDAREGHRRASAARRRSPSASSSRSDVDASHHAAPGDDRRADRRGGAGRPRCPRRRRPHAGDALLRHDLRRRRASCTRATRCATRPRGSAGAGSSRATTPTSSCASSASSAASSSATSPCCSTAAPACS